MKSFVVRHFRKTKRQPLTKKARRILALGLWVLFFTYAFFTIGGDRTIFYAPRELITEAMIYGWAAALIIILFPLYFHWAIKPIDAPDSHGGSISQMGLAIIAIAWFVGNDVYENHVFKDTIADYRTYEVPVVATIDTGGRSSSRGILTLAIDPAQPSLWHLRNYSSGNWNGQRGHCVHIDVFRTKSGVRYSESYPHQAPCSRAWAPLNDEQNEYLRTYAYRHSTFTRSFKITRLIDYASAGLENRTCPIGHGQNNDPAVYSARSLSPNGG